MISFQCNIDKTDRTNRIVLGVLILIAVLFGFGKVFFTILALALIVEGIIGWCAIPVLTDKIKELNLFK